MAASKKKTGKAKPKSTRKRSAKKRPASMTGETVNALPENFVNELGSKTWNVLVAGSMRGLDSKTKRRDEFKQACSEIGAALDSRGVRILIGSLEKETADYWIWRGADRTGTHSPKVRLIRPEQQPSSGYEESDSGGVQMVVVDGSFTAARQEMVDQAHGLIIICGDRGTEEIWDIAVERGTPRIAIPAFGGKAKEHAGSDSYTESVWKGMMSESNDPYQWHSESAKVWLDHLETQMHLQSIVKEHAVETIAEHEDASVYLRLGNPFDFPSDMLVVPEDLEGQRDERLQNAVRYRLLKQVPERHAEWGEVQFVRQTDNEPPHIAYASLYCPSALLSRAEFQKAAMTIAQYASEHSDVSLISVPLIGFDDEAAANAMYTFVAALTKYAPRAKLFLHVPDSKLFERLRDESMAMSARQAASETIQQSSEPDSAVQSKSHVKTAGRKTVEPRLPKQVTESEQEGQRSEQQPAESIAESAEDVHLTDAEPREVGPQQAERRPEADFRLPTSRIEVIFPRFQPPPDDAFVELDIRGNTAELKYRNQEYGSPIDLQSDEVKSRLLAASAWPREYGQLLFDRVIRTEEADGYTGRSTRTGFDTAMQSLGDALTFALDVDPEDRKLRSIKWEYLWQGTSPAPLAVRERTPFYRLVGGRTNQRRAPLKGPIKVLVAISNPESLGKSGNQLLETLSPLEINKELAVVSRALTRIRDAGLATFRILSRASADPVTLPRLNALIEDHGYNVIHIVAHGVRLADGTYYLVLENDEGAESFVSSDQLWPVVHRPSVRLVLLAACLSGQESSTEVYRALGPQLAAQGVPAVVSMQDFLPLETSLRFNQHFYGDLARSGRVEMAMAATRFALHQHNPASNDWGIPVLHMRGDCGALFDVDLRKASKLGEPDPRTEAEDQSELIDTLSETIKKITDAGRTPTHKDLQGALDNPRRTSVSEEIAVPQDRPAITRGIKRSVKISAAELARYIQQEAKLVLGETVPAQIASALNTGQHLILTGPPGTGKTSLAIAIAQFAVAEKMTPAFASTTASAAWSSFETVGGYTPTRGQTLVFRPGVFLQAIIDGSWLVVDEINRTEIDKSVGELFTVLSNQQVDLPYEIRGEPVRVLPAQSESLAGWIPDDRPLGDYDYVVHPNWRVIGTMNVYDKSTLFDMSFAFMRRFAFVEIDIPPQDPFLRLKRNWLQDSIPENTSQVMRAKLEQKLADLFDPTTRLMNWRTLGPAIAKDMILYIGDRCDDVRVADDDEASAQAMQILAEAFLLYCAPQLDAIPTDVVQLIDNDLYSLFEEQKEAAAQVRRRLRQLYPHIAWSEEGGEGNAQ